VDEKDITGSWLKVFKTLNESQARWLAAEKAMQLGRGGIERVHEATDLSRPTIIKGIRELRDPKGLPHPERIRKPGGGRKRISLGDREIVRELERIVGESTAGDPMSPLKWTEKSTRTLSTELKALGHTVSPMTVYRVLREMGYSLQANRRTIEGGGHPDREGQFRHIAKQVQKQVRSGQPVISVDAKKQEYIGNFKNEGRTWRKKRNPIPVNAYDFKNTASGVALPYGIFDEQRNQGLVNVGISHETGEFAVESIRTWWRRFGKRHYPGARELLICADGGGGNGSRNRLWKIQLQVFCDTTGLTVTVCHYPPGTSKWNKIEHKMFSFISMNWKGVPLQNYETVISLIGSTRTRSGLKVSTAFDKHEYETGVVVTDADLETLNLTGHAFHPQWNYTISPRA
jgi:hypothetical protein